jgi:8-oxo-dGTP pyrophosphatase MutT (NUDIX family)
MQQDQCTRIFGGLHRTRTQRGANLMGRFSRAITRGLGIGHPPQVAAVCYRTSGSAVEFLLVNTSSGKWTFPKGRLEVTLSASESAAAEAWEEAGARGVIEGESFGVYVDAKRAPGSSDAFHEITIAAYLMEVHTAVVPQESGRNPSWFTAQEAKRRLSESRATKYSQTIHKIVDAAVHRIGSTPAGADFPSREHQPAQVR